MSSPKTPEGMSLLDQLKQAGREIVNAPTRFMDWFTETQHPIDDALDTIRQFTEARQQHQSAAKQAYSAGDYKKAAEETAFSVPFVGPMLANAGEEAKTNPVLGGIHMAEIAAPLAGPAAEALGDVAPAVAEGLSKTGGAVKAAAKAGGPDILAGTAKVGAAEIAGQTLPGMEWPARIGLGYPGFRQVAGGLKQAWRAGKEAMAAEPEAAAAEAPAGFGVASGDTTAWKPPAEDLAASPPAGTPNPAYRPPVSGELPGRFPARPPAPTPASGAAAPAPPSTAGPTAIEEAAARLQQEYPQQSAPAAPPQPAQPAGPFKVEPWHVAEMTQKQFLRMAKDDPAGAARIQGIADSLNRMGAENARPPAPPAASNGNSAASPPQTMAPSPPPAAAPPQSAPPEAVSLPNVDSPQSPYLANGEKVSPQYRAEQIRATNSTLKAQRMADAILRINPNQDVGHLAANIGNDAAWQSLAKAANESLPGIETRSRVIDAINQRRAAMTPQPQQ
jgi:hypothetical protein